VPFRQGVYEEIWSGKSVQGPVLRGEAAPHGVLLFHIK
jgi:hypothetical protein